MSGISDIQKQIDIWAQNLTLRDLLDYRSKRPLKCTKEQLVERPRAQQPPSASTECSYHDELI